ncbi:MAG: ABC transporter ATP-binding protein [Chloroflexi bacterium]|nr:ABC transporter ATP-binding protein [Chloroflexota bacterium]
MDQPLNDLPGKLSVHGLVVRRGARTIVDVPELAVGMGEVLAIVGPNGAGKTTLVLQMALLERPTSGEVRFEDQPVRGHELALRRRMAVVFQEPLLLDRPVLANVGTGLGLRGVGRVERRERALRWLRRFGIEQLGGRSSRTLSGGEAQRVSLARAFALEPEVLLLDEPFSALDTPARAAIIDDLAAVLAETQTTTVLVTHDHDEAARLGDRVAVMMGGHVLQAGEPSDVFGAPADERVAAFVGIETMAPAEVISREGELVVLAARGHTIEAVGAGAFQRALVCLRPEDVGIAAPGDQEAESSVRNRLLGRVVRVLRTGADARVEIDCGFPVIARITRRSLDELGIEPGSSVVATFKATAVHLIPK